MSGCTIRCTCSPESAPPRQGRSGVSDQAAGGGRAGGRCRGGQGPFRAIVADCFYGDHVGFVEALDRADRPYVLALKPQKVMWAPADAAPTPVEAAQALRWDGPDAPGDWTRVVWRFRD